MAIKDIMFRMNTMQMTVIYCVEDFYQELNMSLNKRDFIRFRLNICFFNHQKRRRNRKGN